MNSPSSTSAVWATIMLDPTFEFSAAENAACKRLIALALDEDLGTDGESASRGDVTSQAMIPPERAGQAVFVARAPGVLAGIHAVRLVLHAVDPHLRLEALKEDGERLAAEEPLALVAGSMRSILAAERCALNFVQHLSGIASLTRRYVDAVAGLDCQILDTRKTLPGWRLLAKYAIRCGGGHNHRMGLYDGVLIKDNHLAAQRFADAGPDIASLVAAARQHAPGLPLEIEVDNLEQFDDALACRPDIILLDNMSLADLREAVERRSAAVEDTDYVFLEASGGVNLHTVRAIAETGVERISVGALTHSAAALDIALDYSAP
jgi:nicotinate-nucleotide pyrophosphorylase (carboxylating)